MDDRKICDYFVIAGLPSASKRAKQNEHNLKNNSSPQHKKYDQHLAPITDITIIITSLDEEVPEGYECVDKTPTGYPADLNHNSLKCECIYLCYRRGIDKPPLTDIGVYYESKDDLRKDSEIVEQSYYGRCGNVNNGNSKIYLTYRRSKPNAPCNQLVVTDICVILANKGETPPHAFNLIQKNLNKGLIGSDVFICYKKSMNSPPLLRYTPSIIDRYPLKDHPDCYQLPESIPLFCLPLGSTIECWPKENTKVLPLTSTFVLTSNSGSKVYGAALTFHENFQLDELDTLTNAELKKLGYFSGFEQINKKLVVNKAICLLSRWPFFELFEGFLNYLYKSVFRSFKKPLSLPVEVYISHFMINIPFPSIKRPKIRIQLSQLEEDQLTLSNPFEETPLPLSGANYVNFLQTLGSENCMNVFLFALTEQKLLLHSLRLDVLTSVAEALTSLIFPFHFECPYIPLCPLQLCDVLNAPLPYIVGVDSRYFDKSNFDSEMPNDLICIDLDTQSIYMSETKRNLNFKLVPKKAYKNLKKSLENIALRLNNTMLEMRKEKPSISFSLLTKKLEKQFGVEIQEQFLQFMVFILKDFRSYLMPIDKQPSIGSTDPNSLFDFKGFIASRERSHHQFYTLLMNTQMFTRFIEERTFFSEKYTSLTFFDDCLNRIENTENADFSTFKLIELDDRDKNEYCTFISDPESLINSSNYKQIYKYNKFGPFNHDLFLEEPILSHFDANRKTSIESRPFEDIIRLQSSTSNLNLQLQTQQNVAYSPMMKRTKAEMRTAQRVAKRLAETPLTWSKMLISYCYSLWFVHLHSYVRANQQLSMKAKLKIAFSVLLRMQSLDLHPLDEVCYRILMLLAGIYNQPILAIKILQQMKQHNIVPNALTYGYYNKAVLEGDWRTDSTDENLYWKRLRYLVQVSGYLRRLGKRNAERKIKEENIHDMEKTSDLLNNVMPDKHDSLFTRQANKMTSSFRERKLSKNRSLFNEELAHKSSCIVKGNPTNRFSNLSNHSNEAGLLINSRIYESHTRCEKKVFDRKRHKSEEHSDDRAFNLLKIRAELLNVSSTLPTNIMNSRKNCFRSQSLSTYKQEDTLDSLKNDVNQCATIFEQHTRTPSTASSQLVENENLIDLNMKNSSSNDLINQTHNNCLNRSISKDLTSRRPSKVSTSCSDELINKKTNNLQSMESLDDENSTFSPLKDAIKNMSPFFADNKVASRLRSSFRTVKSFSKSQFANSSFFKYGTSLTRQQSTVEPLSSQQSMKNSLPENGISNDSLNSNEIKCNMIRSSTLPMTISSASNDGSECSKKSNSSIETETANAVQSSNDLANSMSKSHSSTDFNSIWQTKFNTNKHMDYYLNSTFKFASNTMNRLSEIKSTLSNTTSPGKPQTTDPQANNDLFTNLGQGTTALFTNIASMVADKFPANVGPFSEYLYNEYYTYDATDSGAGATKQSNETGISDKFFDTLEQQYKLNRESAATQLLKIEITSCSKCYNCMAFLYDEEIMAQWTPDDSNLNTTCRYCEKLFVPKLTIKIKQNKNFSSSKDEASLVNAMKRDAVSKDQTKEEPTFEDYKKFSIAYLTPIVLRKELENIVANEGDFCLTSSQFVLEHDIIYWNLVWYFKRVNLPTHLTGLYLTQFLKERFTTNDVDSKQADNVNLDFRNVNVVCLWDNNDLYEGMPKPLYYFWKKSYSKDFEETSSLVSALVTEKSDNQNKVLFNLLLDHICNHDLVKAFRFFIDIRKKNKTVKNSKYVYSVYRDLLFLLFTAYERNSIDHITFDRYYRHAYDQLTDEEAKLMRITDKPPSLRATFCRRSFKHLLLVRS